MRCLYCDKEFNERSKPEEIASSWHVGCAKKFFGTFPIPDFDFSIETLRQIATKNVRNGYTVPGVQKKLSLYLSKSKKHPRLAIPNCFSGYILKPQADEYEALPEAEYLAMSMAITTNIKTVPFALVHSSKDASLAYITKRIDRISDGTKIRMLAMEDFCQLDHRLTIDKYHGSYERCAKIISKYSAEAGLDIAELFLRVVFSYVIGNSDMHLKNLSLIEKKEASNEYHLSEAYDILPTNIIIPADEEEMALTLNGKKKNLRKNDFLNFAMNASMNPKSAEKIITKVIALEDKYIDMCENSYLPCKMKEELENLIRYRIARLK